MINIFDKDVSQVNRKELPLLRRRIGVVFQEFRLLITLPPLTTGAAAPSHGAARG
jgi:ABC-type ATPase involved in cell division